MVMHSEGPEEQQNISIALSSNDVNAARASMNASMNINNMPAVGNMSKVRQMEVMMKRNNDLKINDSRII